MLSLKIFKRWSVFPLGNLYFVSTVEKFQILEYRKVEILLKGPVTILSISYIFIFTVSKDMVRFFKISGSLGGNLLNLHTVALYPFNHGGLV